MTIESATVSFIHCTEGATMLRWEYIYCAVIVIITLLILQCGSPVAGSGTQTTNGIYVTVASNSVQGYLYSVDNENVRKNVTDTADVELILFSENYQPYDSQGFSKVLVIDDTGAFFADSLQDGNYNLLSVNNTDSTSVIFKGLTVTGLHEDYSKDMLFSRWRSIKVTIDDSSRLDVPYKGVYIPGTPFFSIASNSDTFCLDKISSETYKVFADYFTKSGTGRFLRVKGFKDTTDSDNLKIYTDSISVTVDDSLVNKIDMKL